MAYFVSVDLMNLIRLTVVTAAAAAFLESAAPQYKKGSELGDAVSVQLGSAVVKSAGAVWYFTLFAASAAPNSKATTTLVEA